MENLGYLARLGWGTWSPPYVGYREDENPGFDKNSLRALEWIHEVIKEVGQGHEKMPTVITAQPIVVLVGRKGCGKTSVIESIIGTGFLPKRTRAKDAEKPFEDGGGEKVVEENGTRCPVEVNLVRVPPVNECRLTNWIELLHYPGRKFYPEDFPLVEDLIRERMEKFRDEPLVVNYFSSAVTNLTLVDLPGLTFEGDVPLESPERTIAEKFIKNPNAVILAVMEATEEKREMLKLINFILTADPMEERTLMVLSKWDEIQHAIKEELILWGDRFKFGSELGIICIQNRSWEQVSRNCSVQGCQVEQEHRILTRYLGFPNRCTGVGVGPRYLVNRICEVVIYLWGSRLKRNPKELKVATEAVLAHPEKLPHGLPNSKVECLFEKLAYVKFVMTEEWEKFGIEGHLTLARRIPYYEQLLCEY